MLKLSMSHILLAAASAAGALYAEDSDFRVPIDHNGGGVAAKVAAAREHHYVWSPFLGQLVDKSPFAPWALWHSPAAPVPHATAHKDTHAHAHAVASEKHTTLISLLSMPLIRKRFLEALPSWLHHSESPDASHLDFLETEDAMKVRVLEDEDSYTITTDASQHASVAVKGGMVVIYTRIEHHNTTLDSAGANFSIHELSRDSTRTHRSLHLPGDADMDGVTAKLVNGTLTVRVPKVHAATAGMRHISVE